MSDDDQGQTLGDKLPRERARVRELVALYRSVGPAGFFAAASMEKALQRADQAMIQGNLMDMIQTYQDLQGFTE